MSGRFIELTKNALLLFFQSLPIGCTFSVLSFGSDSMFTCYNKKEPIWQYNDESLIAIKNEIRTFKADLGGTEILMPLKKCMNLDCGRK